MYPFVASARSAAGLYLARPVMMACLNTSLASSPSLVGSLHCAALFEPADHFQNLYWLDFINVQMANHWQDVIREHAR